MYYSMPGFVLCCLLEFAQIYVHLVGNAVYHLIICCPLLMLPSVFPSIIVFSSELTVAAGGQSTGGSASTSVLAVNIQGWFLLGLTGLISLKSRGLSRVFSSTNLKASVESINSSVLSLLCGPSHTSVHDYWKNHSFDWMKLCQKYNASAFQYAVYVGHRFSSKVQATFNFMAAVTICSNFGAQENKVFHCFHCFPIYFPWSDGTGCHDLGFSNVEF